MTQTNTRTQHQNFKKAQPRPPLKPVRKLVVQEEEEDYDHPDQYEDYDGNNYDKFMIFSILCFRSSH